MTKEEIRAWMLAHGADNAAVIQQSSIVLNPEFRAVCAQNSCGGYGQCGKAGFCEAKNAVMTGSFPDATPP